MKRPPIPDDIVCFANLSGVKGAYFASLYAFGFRRQLTVGEVLNLKELGGRYQVAHVWSREEHLARRND